MVGDEIGDAVSTTIGAELIDRATPDPRLRLGRAGKILTVALVLLLVALLVAFVFFTATA
jgi:hypothetical protein